MSLQYLKDTFLNSFSHLIFTFFLKLNLIFSLFCSIFLKDFLLFLLFCPIFSKKLFNMKNKNKNSIKFENFFNKENLIIFLLKLKLNQFF